MYAIRSYYAAAPAAEVEKPAAEKPAAEKPAAKETAKKPARSASRKAAAGPVPSGKNPWESKAFGGGVNDDEDEEA